MRVVESCAIVWADAVPIATIGHAVIKVKFSTEE